MFQLVVVLSGPERTRAKAEVALEDAGLPIFPADHYAVGRESYTAAHWVGFLSQLPSGEEPDEQHGFVAVLANGAAELNAAVRVCEPHNWVLRVHYELPDEPRPDPVAATLAEMRAEIAALKAKVGVA